MTTDQDHTFTWEQTPGALTVRLPTLPDKEPCTLTVTSGTLKIECAGPNRDMDYTWDLSEIADIRLCPTNAGLPISFSLMKIFRRAFNPAQLIRVSVLHPTGEVDDIVINVPAQHWTEPLETQLRAHLRLSTPSPTP